MEKTCAGKNKWNISPRKDISQYTGFVYQVTEKDTGMVYIGIKKFWRKVRRAPLKGRKRKRIDYVPSDWKEYKTSSPLMQKKLTKSPQNYTYECLRLCSSVSEMKIHEAHLQLKEYVDGNWSGLYNEYIGLRMRIR